MWHTLQQHWLCTCVNVHLCGGVTVWSYACKCMCLCVYVCNRGASDNGVAASPPSPGFRGVNEKICVCANIGGDTSTPYYPTQSQHPMPPSPSPFSLTPPSLLTRTLATTPAPQHFKQLVPPNAPHLPPSPHSSASQKSVNGGILPAQSPRIV